MPLYLPRVRNGCLVVRATNLTALTGNNIVSWDTELYDDANWFDPAAPTRLSVPLGIDRIRITANLAISSVDDGTNYLAGLVITGDVNNTRRGNSSSPKLSTTTAGVRLSLVTGPIPVVGGTDYIELRISPNPADTNYTIDNIGSNFCVESC